MNTLSFPLIEAPASDEAVVRETLAYLDAFDAVLNTDYALVAFKETHRASGAWWVRLNSLHGPSSVFHPNAIRLQARATSAQGKSGFDWGNALTPTTSDLRQIVFRVLVRKGQPSSVEMRIRLRRFDHSADEVRSVVFPWPED